MLFYFKYTIFLSSKQVYAIKIIDLLFKMEKELSQALLH